MKIGMIGNGAIAQYVSSGLAAREHHLGAVLMRPDRVRQGAGLEIGSVNDLPSGIDLVIDCAGHEALACLGPQILARGVNMITVSLGALADPKVSEALSLSAKEGNAKLHLASGAIGALDCLAAARAGKLSTVTYVGRKPPGGWKGSAAEAKLDLDDIVDCAVTHFEGTARVAALSYPKNANVAAAVALAGLGFDHTRVQLIADPSITQNVHEIRAEGDFGNFHFQINGNALPDNPRSSALAAMSILAKLDQITQRITL
ncbi:MULTISPECIES: aspartate dehydrogenase [unclassified Ruegeria]|uniref:aspartate dehydrogenase n=1 Tax=unclassified Ruegeria TaxID=2625375 RepID=UPI001489CE31|nr:MULTISPECIES: aspartate dehydrogenase [unclassified Ruegeria]